MLRQFGFHDARDYAKWSCVRNPYQDPSYSLPIGFIQSPALATLTLMKSPLIEIIEQGNKLGIFTSVYLDDIICSGKDLEKLATFFAFLLEAIGLSKFTAHKIIAPSSEIQVFNCNIRQGYANVLDDRVQKFIAGVRMRLRPSRDTAKRYGKKTFNSSSKGSEICILLSTRNRR